VGFLIKDSLKNMSEMAYPVTYLVAYSERIIIQLARASVNMNLIQVYISMADK